MIVVNTCVVTTKAEHETRKLIRGLRRNNPEAFLVVCGCWVDQVKSWNEKVLKMVDLVVRNEEERGLVEKIERARKEKLFKKRRGQLIDEKAIKGVPKKTLEKVSSRHSGLDPESIQIVSKYSMASRSLVWIQSGCQQFCSYCLVPYVRGPMVNRPAKEATERVKQLVKKGMREVILTGVNLSY